MKEKNITVYNKNMKDMTDWPRVRAMTEKDIIAGAKSDPDAPLLTPRELKGFRRVNPPKVKEINVRKIRIKLGLSQEQFSHYFGVSIRTIQEWEQGRRKPGTMARNFLKIIAAEPALIQKILRKIM